MKKLTLIVILAFFSIACSSSPCSLKEGYTVKGCKEKSKSGWNTAKDGWKDLKEKVEK